MLAYFGEWHRRRKLAPAALRGLRAQSGRRAAGVAGGGGAARVSHAAEAKAGTKRTPEDLPVQSLRTPLDQLGPQTLYRVTLLRDDQHEFELLGVDRKRIVSSKRPR